MWNFELAASLLKECLVKKKKYLQQFTLAQPFVSPPGVRSENGAAEASQSDPGPPRHREDRHLRHHRLPPVPAGQRVRRQWLCAAPLCLLSLHHSLCPARLQTGTGVRSQQHRCGSADREDRQDGVEGRQVVRQEPGGHRVTSVLPGST